MMGKKSAEFMLLADYRHSGLPVKIIRPGFVYGANLFGDSRVYNSLIAKAASGDEIVLNLDGLLSIPMVYVVDVVRAVFMALSSEYDGEAFNISGDNVSLRTFVEVVANTFDKKVTYALKTDEFKTSEAIINNIISEKACKKLMWSEDNCLASSVVEAVMIKKEMMQLS